MIESTSHIFITCDLTSVVWYMISKWLKRQKVLPSVHRLLLEFVLSLGGIIKCRREYKFDMQLYGFFGLFEMSFFSFFIKRERSGGNMYFLACK